MDDIRSSSITLIISGESLDPTAVTGLLGLAPTKFWRKGEKTKSGSTIQRSGWKLLQDSSLDGKALQFQLNFWLDLLSKKQEQIGQIRKQGNTIEFTCFIISGSAPTIELEATTLLRLGELGIDLKVEFLLREADS